jgi:hypothetical protein
VPGLSRIPGIRIVATPAALDALVTPDDTLILRLAPDEALIVREDLGAPVAQPEVDDEHAIVEPDAGFAGAWWPIADATRRLERTCEWELPTMRPALAQGAVAEIPAKLWLEEERVLVLVPAPLQADFEERMP